MNITNTAIQNPAQKINPKAVTRIQSTASGTVTNSRMKRRRAIRAISKTLEGTEYSSINSINYGKTFQTNYTGREITQNGNKSMLRGYLMNQNKKW